MNDTTRDGRRQLQDDDVKAKAREAIHALADAIEDRRRGGVEPSPREIENLVALAEKAFDPASAAGRIIEILRRALKTTKALA